MSKKAGTFAKLTLETQVRRAMSAANDLIFRGIDANNDNPDDGQSALSIQAIHLVGHDGPSEDDADDEDANILKYEDCLSAAYALGIAVGQLLQPGLFLKRGAR